MALVVTVSQVNRRLALLVKGDNSLQNISVKGEISDLKYHSSGHIYFSLSDESASIKAVMFKSSAKNLSFKLENGMNVIVSGAVGFFERSGIFSLYAYNVQQEEGIGTGALSFEQTKEKLAAEGLFDQKRPLPENPKSICVITSETGAAIKDIINVLSRRCPFIKLKLVSVQVQGETAPDSIAKGLEKAQNSGCDLIIFGRGGGSSEDLSAFNSEIVVRAVYGSKIPTISAVGHEIDVSLTDFAADKSAPTPSAAAEIAVPDVNETLNLIKIKRDRIGEMAYSVISRSKSKLDNLFSRISFYNPKNRIKEREISVNKAYSLIKKDFAAVISKKESVLQSKFELLDSFNPLKTLERGYSIIYKDNSLISSAESVKKGDNITVKMSDGEFNAVVTD